MVTPSSGLAVSPPSCGILKFVHLTDARSHLNRHALTGDPVNQGENGSLIRENPYFLC